MTAPAPTKRPAKPVTPGDEGAAAGGRAISPDQRLQHATRLMAMQRWADAAAILDIPDAPPNLAMTRRLALNLNAMLAVRPTVYQTLFQALAGGEAGTYRYFTSGRGDVGLLKMLSPTQATPLCAGREPVDALHAMLRQHAEPLATDHVLALLGLGDGYVLDHFARHPPKLAMPAMKPLVSVIEPDPHLVLAVMRLHDLSGDDGPIRQTRFRWYIGSEWAQQLIADVDADAYLPPPQYCVLQGPGAAALSETLRDASNRYMQQITALHDRVMAQYAARSADDFAAMLSSDPPRRPRMLLMTSRFTTVLQHSTRDVAAAMEQLGWDTLIHIEPTDDHRCWNGGLTRCLDDFKPDVIFSIDHLRREQRNALPPEAPFVCWVQDHLPNLTCTEAGTSVGMRDFVLSAVKPMYTGLWNYPARQIVETPKLTAIPPRPTSWSQDGPDLVYVSTASADPAELAEQCVDSAREAPRLQQALRTCCERMLALYQRGESLPTMWHIGQLADRVVEEQGNPWPDASLRATVVNRLNHPLNNALYRQQALRWVINVARDMDLSLGLYGTGWDARPEFKPYARGWISYGEDLQNLTRRSKINLQIIPSICTHQRLLDGLVAGGFFLIRQSPYDTLLAEVARFLEQHAPDAESIEDVRPRLGGAHREKFEQLLRDAACLSDIGTNIDMVGWVQGCRRMQLFDPCGDPLPRLGDVSFADESTLRQRIERFLEDRPMRDAIAAEQRASVEQRVTYRAGMQRSLAAIHRLLAEEACHVDR